MSWRKRLNDMPRGTKRLLAGTLGVVVAVGATLALLWAKGPKQGPRGQPRATTAAGTPRMEGMAGMGAASGGTVQLTPDQLRTFGVSFGTVEERTLSDEVRTVGVVAFDETRTAQVTPKVGGYLEKLYVDFTGQPVRRGQPMVEIYSPELVAAEQELLLAARLRKSMGESAVPGVPGNPANLVDAARGRLRLWDISEAQIDGILRTSKVRRTLTLYAPVSGVVVQKQVLQGAAVQPGQPLYTIADLSSVWVEAELREADAGAVREGSTAIVELAAFPGRPIQGRVQFVYPTMDAQARTLTARIGIPNPDGRIKPGMYATVRLSAPVRRALTVPASAVVNTGERKLAFMDIGGGKLMPMEIETGRTAGDYTEVLSGLEPGQRVVTSAQFLLDSESNLGEVMRSMIGQMGAQDMGKMQDMPGMDVGPGSGFMPGTSAPEPGAASGGTTDNGADMRGMKGMTMPPKER